jgi:hypothetical protein
MRLDDIDAARGGAEFWFRHDGQNWEIPSPVDMPWQHVMAYMDARGLGVHTFGLSLLQVHAVFDAWARRYGLPSFEQSQRLAYLVDHYHDDLEYELQRIHGVDLDELWRARSWRRLLALTDRLPRNTLYSAAVSNDPEHAAMLAKAMTDAKAESGPEDEDAPKGPPIHEWSPELEALTGLGDKLNWLIYVTQAIAAQGKSVPKPDAAPRPVTELARALRRAEHERRKDAHQTLAARLLPHKYPPKAE